MGFGFREVNDVVVLKDRHPTNNTSKVAFLPNLALDVCWNGGAVSHVD